MLLLPAAVSRRVKVTVVLVRLLNPAPDKAKFAVAEVLVPDDGVITRFTPPALIVQFGVPTVSPPTLP